MDSSGERGQFYDRSQVQIRRRGGFRRNNIRDVASEIVYEKSPRDLEDEKVIKCLEVLTCILKKGTSFPSRELLATEICKYEKEKVLRAINICVMEIPLCASFYAGVIYHLNTKDIQLVADLIEMQSSNFSDYLKKGDFLNAKILLRFFAELVNKNIVDCSDFMKLCELLVSVNSEPEKSLYRCDSYNYLVLSVIPFVAKKLKENANVASEFNRLILEIGNYISNRSSMEDYKSVNVCFNINQIVSWSSLESNDPLVVLYLQIRKSLDENIDIVFFRIDEDFSDDCTKHSLSYIVVPCDKMFVPDIYKPKLYFFVPEFKECDESICLPDVMDINRYVLNDIITDSMRLYSNNHFECSRLLLEEKFFTGSKNSEETQHSNEECYNHLAGVVESVFSELTALPNTFNNAFYYNNLLIDMLNENTDIFPKVLGRAIRILFQIIDSDDTHSKGMDVECFRRLTNWMAVHLSNFSFTWNWKLWAEYLNSPRDHGAFCFIREVLSFCTRLSYREGMMQKVPNEFAECSDIFPPNQESFNYRYDLKNISDSTMGSLIEQIQRGISMRTDPKKIEGLLEEISNTPYADVDNNPLDAPKKKDVFLETILFFGSKSFSYLLQFLERNLDLIKEFNETLEEMIDTICLAANFYGQREQFFEITLDKLMNYRIISEEAVIIWCFSSEVIDQIYCEGILYRILKMVLEKSKLRLMQNEATLKERLNTLYPKARNAEKDEEVVNVDEDKESRKKEIIAKCEANKERITDEERRILLILLSKFFTTITSKFSEFRSQGIEPLNTPWARWMIGTTLQVCRNFRQNVIKVKDELDEFAARGNLDTCVLGLWEALKTYCLVYEQLPDRG